MNVRHCNECNGTVDVSEVTLSATRLVPADASGQLGKPERVLIEGDLCARCLETVRGMIAENGIGDYEPPAALPTIQRRRGMDSGDVT